MSEYPEKRLLVETADNDVALVAVWKLRSSGVYSPWRTQPNAQTKTVDQKTPKTEDTSTRNPRGLTIYLVFIYTYIHCEYIQQLHTTMDKLSRVVCGGSEDNTFRPNYLVTQESETFSVKCFCK